MIPRRAIPLTVFAFAVLATSAHGLDARFWTLTPYKVRVRVAVDVQSTTNQRLADHVASHLSERADAAIGALWDMTVEPLGGAERLAALRGLSDEELRVAAKDEERPCDKLIVISIRETVDGVTATAVECDPILEVVSEPVTSPPRPLHAAAESAFAMACEVFSPVASFEVDRGSNGGGAVLAFRGARLPRRPGLPQWATPGRVLAPILRRTDREGNVVEDGIRQVPWTYFVIAESTEDDTGVPATVYSHTQRPFGTRRRGRVEQYALLLRDSDTPTHIRLHVKGDQTKPLPGYQAFQQDGLDGEREPVGSSDADGLIPVARGEQPIQVVYIKSGSQLVAKAPVPVGAVRQVEIPLLDERRRLDAEAQLGLLREELIDVIARRSILAAQIRNALDADDRDGARKLLIELEGMDGRTQFERKLNRVQQRAKSDDPVVQKRIDQQFSDTLIVLGAFLGPGQIDELRAEVAGGS